MTFVTLDKLQLILQNINPLGLKNLLFISLWDLNCEVFLILDGILAIDFVSQTLNYFPRIVTIVLIMEYIHRIMRVRLYPVSVRKYVYFDLPEKNFEICKFSKKFNLQSICTKVFTLSILSLSHLSSNLTEGNLCCKNVSIT